MPYFVSSYHIKIWIRIYIPLRRLKVAILKWPTPCADSAELAIFYENLPFLKNQPFLSTFTLKVRGIGHNSEESARVQVEIGKKNQSLKNRHF